MASRPSSLVECDELIFRTERCASEAHQRHERALECDCRDTLAELYAIRAALTDVPRQRSVPPDDRAVS